jgi:nucleoside-diphosphate-sugar epimerase
VRYEHFAPGDALHTGADLTRARQLLGFAPKTTLAHGLEAEVEWIREWQRSDARNAA